MTQYRAYLQYYREMLVEDESYFQTCENHFFWTSKTEIWPQLADAALNAAQIPTSSIAAERVFATARTIDTPQRQSLGWDSFCNHVALTVNKQSLETMLENHLVKLQRLQ